MAGEAAELVEQLFALLDALALAVIFFLIAAVVDELREKGRDVTEVFLIAQQNRHSGTGPKMPRIFQPLIKPASGGARADVIQIRPAPAEQRIRFGIVAADAIQF